VSEPDRDKLTFSFVLLKSTHRFTQKQRDWSPNVGETIRWQAWLRSRQLASSRRPAPSLHRYLRKYAEERSVAFHLRTPQDSRLGFRCVRAQGRPQMKAARLAVLHELGIWFCTPAIQLLCSRYPTLWGREDRVVELKHPVCDIAIGAGAYI